MFFSNIALPLTVCLVDTSLDVLSPHSPYQRSESSSHNIFLFLLEMPNYGLPASIFTETPSAMLGTVN